MFHIYRHIVMALLLASASLITACSSASSTASTSTLAGTWVRNDNQLIEVYHFSTDGKYEYAQYSGSTSNAPITQREGMYELNDIGYLQIDLETQEKLYIPRIYGNRLELREPNLVDVDGSVQEGSRYVFTKVDNPE